MREVKLSLPDAPNWEPLPPVTHIAANNPNIPNHVHTPIPEFTIPFLLDKPVIAVLAESVSSKPNWFFAGLMFQRISTGITLGGGYDANSREPLKILLHTIQVLSLPLYSNSYAIAFKPPFWLGDVTLYLWQYNGDTRTDTERKIDSLITQHQQATI